MTKLSRMAQLDPFAVGVFYEQMGRLLDRLVEGSHAYRVRREADGYTLIAQPDCFSEFNDLVREATSHAGDDFVVFPTSDGGLGYTQMFVLPMNDTEGAGSDERMFLP